MNTEQALKSNGPADDQFTKFVEPKDASIKITITTDTRMSGTHRLAYLIGQLLKREGYLNVAPVVPSIPEFWENEELVHSQKEVRIEIEDPLTKAVADFKK